MSNEIQKKQLCNEALDCVNRIFNIAANEIGDEEKNVFSDIKSVLPKLRGYVNEMERLTASYEKLTVRKSQER